MRTANHVTGMGTGRTAGTAEGDQTLRGPKRMAHDASGMRQASRQAPADGSHHETK